MNGMFFNLSLNANMVTSTILAAVSSISTKATSTRGFHGRTASV